MPSYSRLLHATLLTILASQSALGADERVTTKALKDKVATIVVIYAENRSFDNLYGLFPGANGIPGVNPTSHGKYAPQVDRDGKPLTMLPQTWGGVTAPGQTPVVTQAQSANLRNAPFDIAKAFGTTLSIAVITRDLYHRFFENQMQIGNGNNEKFAAYADGGGLTMGNYDGSEMALWKIAQQYVLADNFFMGAFGGSYLNHQYLICACAPEYPNAEQSPAKGSISEVNRSADGKFLAELTQASRSPSSALEGPPVFTNSGNLAPKNYFGDGKFYTINTMQPPYQPSMVPPAADDAAKVYADPSRASTVPPQSHATIGDLLSAKKIAWKWYAGGWNETLSAATTDRKFPPYSPGAVPNFQFHHQPFNYYTRFDPAQHADERRVHLHDYVDLVADARAGSLPPVVFYKPQGNLNQHPGYAEVKSGDEHIAQLISELQKSPQWKNMLIVVTYDENGGLWDHVAPPKGDLLGPGTRIPALIVSPLAKRGYVDHTQYDTASILRLIARRFDLPALPGIEQRDAALKRNQQPPMGDLTAALDLGVK